MTDGLSGEIRRLPRDNWSLLYTPDWAPSTRFLTYAKCRRRGLLCGMAAITVVRGLGRPASRFCL